MKSPKQQLEIKVRELLRLANVELEALRDKPSNAQGKIVFVACAEAIGALKVYHSVFSTIPAAQFNPKPVYEDFMQMVTHLRAVEFDHEFQLDQMKELLENY